VGVSAGPMRYSWRSIGPRFSLYNSDFTIVHNIPVPQMPDQAGLTYLNQSIFHFQEGRFYFDLAMPDLWNRKSV
jgi:hypothetical protein